MLLNTLPAEWLDEKERNQFADWIRSYVSKNYGQLLPKDEEFPITVEPISEVRL